MSPRIEIRPYLAAHLNRILAIEEACFGPEAYPASLFRRYHTECPDLFLVATRNGQIAGYIIACPRRPNAEIISIAVHPTHRRAGVGTALLAYSLKRLSKTGASAVDLMVRAEDRGAIAFYRSFGFEPGRTVARYYDNRTDGLQMTLSRTARGG